MFFWNGHGQDDFYKNMGSDVIARGRGGNDTITGGAGDDLLSGGDGDDLLTSKAGADVIDGGDGDDVIQLFGSAAQTSLAHIYGGSGFDVLKAEASRFTTALAFDRISGIERIEGYAWASSGGASGSTAIIGSARNNVFDFHKTELINISHIDGGFGDDVLIGSRGNDVLWLGVGSDTLTGGRGHDTFVLDAVGSSKYPSLDVVTDFRDGRDRFDLSQLDTNLDLTGHQSFVLIGSQDFSGKGPEVRFTVDAAGNTEIQGDVNGDGAKDFVIHLIGEHRLSEGDFVL